jgi:hypothetical protein
MALRRCLPLVLIVWLVALTSAPPAPTLAEVMISSFDAEGQIGYIVIRWTTASEVNNVGFNLWRDTSVNFVRPTQLNNRQLIPSQCVDCIARTDYVYTDSEVTPGQNYFYKLESVDVNGATDSFGPVSAAAIAPSQAPTRPPTHTPVPSSTPTPTDTPAPTATGAGGPSPTAAATLPTPTPTPTGTPQPETPAVPGSIATATPPVQATTPNTSTTPAPPLLPSPTSAHTVEPGHTGTASVSTVVVPTAAQRPTATQSTAAQATPSVATPAATPKKPASGGGASILTPTWPAQSLSPAAETAGVELGRVLIGTGLIGLGATLGLSVLAVVGYFLWRRSSRP